MLCLLDKFIIIKSKDESTYDKINQLNREMSADIPAQFALID
jgi:hypothetical protein